MTEEGRIGVAAPACRVGVSEELVERHGFTASPKSPGGAPFAPGARTVVGVLSGLPVRVDEGARDDDETPLIRVRFGIDAGDPGALEKALTESSVERVSASRLGVEISVAAEPTESGVAVALASVEDLARRAATVKSEEAPSRSDRSRALAVCGYPMWVEAADTGHVEGVELRHIEVHDADAEWDEPAVSLAPSADGAIVATGLWDGEAPLISLMGRIVLAREEEGRREGRLMFGSGICTLTNRRLLAVLYARPDDGALEGLGRSMKDSGIPSGTQAAVTQTRSA